MTAYEKHIEKTHYRNKAVQPVALIMAWLMGFCEGSIIKYVTRWREKGGVEDLCKCLDYIEFIRTNGLYQRFFREIRRAWLLFNNVFGEMDAEWYIRENQLPAPEAAIVRHVWLYNLHGDLHQLESAEKWLKELIETAEAEGFIPTLVPNVSFAQAVTAMQLLQGNTAVSGGMVSDADWQDAVNVVRDNWLKPAAMFTVPAWQTGHED